MLRWDCIDIYARPGLHCFPIQYISMEPAQKFETYRVVKKQQHSLVTALSTDMTKYESQEVSTQKLEILQHGRAAHTCF